MGRQKCPRATATRFYYPTTLKRLRRRSGRCTLIPKRLRATDPGTVENNPVFQYHDAFNPDTDQVNDFKDRYRAGKVGDVEVKVALAKAINQFLDPIRERRAHFVQNRQLVEDALREGTKHAKTVAAETMSMVRSAMRINSYYKSG